MGRFDTGLDENLLHLEERTLIRTWNALRCSAVSEENMADRHSSKDKYVGEICKKGSSHLGKLSARRSVWCEWDAEEPCPAYATEIFDANNL